MSDREFSALLTENMGFIQKKARQYSTDPDSADDLAQDVAMRAWEQRDKYVPGCFKAWLSRITYNLFISSVRKSQRQGSGYTFISLESISAEGLSCLRTGDADTELLVSEIEGQVSVLSSTYRDVLVLRSEGFRYNEIAAVTGLSVNTVRSRLYDARTELSPKIRQQAWKRSN